MRNGLWPSARGFHSQCGVLRMVSVMLLSIASCLLLAGCVFPGGVKPTVKIGLSAPFEGLYRDQGYEALHAVRLAVRQRNEAGGIGASYWVELVALNDFDEPTEAIIQAQKMAVDSDLMGVLGGWSVETAQAVAPEYERLGLAVLTPMTEPKGCPVFQANPAFREAYMALSGGAPPATIASWTYGATNCLLDALDTAAQTEGRPSRSGVQRALRREQSR